MNKPLVKHVKPQHCVTHTQPVFKLHVLLKLMNESLSENSEKKMYPLLNFVDAKSPCRGSRK